MRGNGSVPALSRTGSNTHATFAPAKHRTARTRSPALLCEEAHTTVHVSFFPSLVWRLRRLLWQTVNVIRARLEGRIRRQLLVRRMCVCWGGLSLYNKLRKMNRIGLKRFLCQRVQCSNSICQHTVSYVFRKSSKLNVVHIIKELNWAHMADLSGRKMQFWTNASFIIHASLLFLYLRWELFNCGFILFVNCANKATFYVLLWHTSWPMMILARSALFFLATARYCSPKCRQLLTQKFYTKLNMYNKSSNRSACSNFNCVDETTIFTVNWHSKSKQSSIFAQ